MSNKLLTVSVGVPAYNEEANIKNLLENLLKQKEEGFVLKEIIVVSDGSTDRTAELVMSVGDTRITFIDDKERKGLSSRQNEILKSSDSDILVMLDADVLPKNISFLRVIINPMIEDSSVGLVAGKLIPILAKTFIEKILYFSREMKIEMFEKINDSDNIYLCHGAARAFSKNFYKKLKWPETASEDAFSYLACKEMGFKFKYAPKAEVYYKLPSNLRDHFRQSVRFMKSSHRVGKKFESLRGIYKIPISVTLRVVAKYFIKNPLTFLAYVFILVVARAKAVFAKEFNSSWDIAISTKRIKI